MGSLVKTQDVDRVAHAAALSKRQIPTIQTIQKMLEIRSSLNTTGTKRKHKSADDDRDPGSWTSENRNELQTARPTRTGVSDEVAQDF